jgi:hypothetical protein
VVVCLIALAGFSPAALAAPTRCDLAIGVTPSAIPATSRAARVRIPAGLSDLQFRASSGTASAPVNVGAGSLVADFTAALDSPPLVLVAALGASACGFTVIRVASSAIVPPAATPVTLVMVEPSSSSADRDGEVLVYVFSIDYRGLPRRDGAPALRPSVGSVARVESIAPGVWRGRWTVPAGEASASSIEAAFGSESPATASLARPPGAPATIELTQETPGPAGGGTPSAAVARIRDSSGNLTDAPLEWTSDFAQLGEPTRVERGVFRVPLVVPPGTAEGSVVVTARADRAVATTSFPVAPSAAAAVRVTPPGRMLAGGSAKGRFEVLEVIVVDAAGKPVNDVPVGSGGRGEFREALPVGPGHWALPYRPPRISEDTTETVTVKAGTASTTVALELQSRRLSVSLGLKGGLAVAGGGVGPSAGAEAGLWTFLGRTQLGLLLDVGWWSLSKNGTATVGGSPSDFESTQSYVPFLLSIGWQTSFADRWKLRATLGGGGAVVSNSSQLGGQPKVSESGFSPAVSGSVSAGPRLGPGVLFLEVRATWIGDPHLSTLSGSSTTFLGLLGYRIDVG